jgi:zinc and cadmium transporter
METLLAILIATIIVSSISFLGAIVLMFNHKLLHSRMLLIVAFAAGTFLGTAFFHLIPESVELYEENTLQVTGEHSHLFLPSYIILLGILVFFVIEKFIHWHHHHDIDCHKHSLSKLSLIGDAVHNFIDGAVIAMTFMVDIRLGIITTIAIIFHEIPQEIGDFSILIHSGYNVSKALLFNFITGLTAIIGALMAYLFLNNLTSVFPMLLAFTAGTFIYISLSDIVPEIHAKKDKINILALSLCMFLGIGLSLTLTLLISH